MEAVAARAAPRGSGLLLSLRVDSSFDGPETEDWRGKGAGDGPAFAARDFTRTPEALRRRRRSTSVAGDFSDDDGGSDSGSHSFLETGSHSFFSFSGVFSTDTLSDAEEEGEEADGLSDVNSPEAELSDALLLSMSTDRMLSSPSVPIVGSAPAASVGFGVDSGPGSESNFSNASSPTGHTGTSAVTGAVLLRARESHRAGDFVAAVSAYDALLEASVVLQPGNNDEPPLYLVPRGVGPLVTSILNNRAISLRKLGRCLDAVRDCQCALALTAADRSCGDPALAYCTLGNALLESRMYSEAVSAYRSGLCSHS
jgi:hypothetical protein